MLFQAISFYAEFHTDLEPKTINAKSFEVNEIDKIDRSFDIFLICQYQSLRPIIYSL